MEVWEREGKQHGVWELLCVMLGQYCFAKFQLLYLSSDHILRYSILAKLYFAYLWLDPGISDDSVKVEV